MASLTQADKATCRLFLEVLLAIFLPPVGVALRYGITTMQFCICLVLTILGYLPGIIYALYVLIAANPDANFGSRGITEPLSA